ncbi:MAG: NAD(P)-dependent oxidoreductase [Sneathiella sp.]
MAIIAFLGTGNMGSGMAKQLIKAGHILQIYNRTRDKALPLAKLGATLMDTPAEAASGADVIFAMVGDDTASEAVWEGNDGVLSVPAKSGALAIECSTLSYPRVQGLSARIREHGLEYLDCPVTGLPTAAAIGELVLLMGGTPETVSKAQPYLSAISKEQILFGDIGAGTAYKLIVNLMGSVQIIALAEGMLVAEKADLDMTVVAKALAEGAAGSGQVIQNGPAMVSGDHDSNVLFSAQWRLKDTDYGAKFAQQMGVEAPLAEESLKQFQKLIDAGFGNAAGSKVIDVMRK